MRIRGGWHAYGATSRQAATGEGIPMTMVAACQQNGCGYLFADTAFVDAATGLVVGFAPKMMKGERFPWIAGVTCNGSLNAPEALAVLQACETASDLLHMLPAALQAFKARSAAEGSPDAYVRLMVVAWDAQCETIRIFVAGDGTDEYQPCYWCPPNVFELAYSFGVSREIGEEVAKLWEGGSPNDPEHFDLHRDGIEAFEIARRKPFTPINGMAPGHYVGGQLIAAEVSATGVEAALWLEWDDQVGEPIRPRDFSSISYSDPQKGELCRAIFPV